MFERPQGGERAVLVHISIQGFESGDEDEFRELASSAGAEVIDLITGNRPRPDPKYFVGSGKAEEIHQRVLQCDAELVIFDHELSPAQERNLEHLFQCRVLDRTGLILDIFAQRARSFEGKLQVELAQLKHLSTRLVRGWTHLERQKGGIGLRGPGETQLETDRRLLGNRIKQINKRLDKVLKQREQGRRSRARAAIPTVSLVGYTNAGKSTLFNYLTESEVYAADQLFATLDPTIRRVDIADAGPVVLADTVGFVRNLPHDLVAAFRSTLEETRQAHLLLHIIDAADPDRDQRIEQVNEVLKEVGAENVPQIEVFNKIDLIEDKAPATESDESGVPRRIWLSAVNGSGVELLIDALKRYFGKEFIHCWIKLAPQDARARAEFFELGVVVNEKDPQDGGFLLEVSIQRSTLEGLEKRFGHQFEKILPKNGQLLAGVDQAP
ncbi:MAG: GTPase HflX [Gammaproteobacteria bacterium]|nr:GTPase HflX [Gammaproteobacteria bacterium]